MKVTSSGKNYNVYGVFLTQLYMMSHTRMATVIFIKHDQQQFPSNYIMQQSVQNTYHARICLRGFVVLLRIRHQISLYIEVRDSRTGYLVPMRDAPGALPDGQSCRDAIVAAVSRHLEIQVDILAGELYLEFVIWF